ncbi:MAG: alpha/beta hydrolase [Chloroflexi bacterium]|nr:alpha/beta hydrolase [Chloroflexota bacterium]
MEPQSRFIAANNLRVHYLEYGQAGPPVVMVHATGFCAATWGPVAEAVAADHRVIVPDLRGHGDTEKGVYETLTWGLLARDMAAFLEALDLRGVAMVGHSRGGSVSILSVAFSKGRIGRMVLLEPSILIHRDRSGQIQGANPAAEQARQRRPGFPSRQAAFDNYHGRGAFKGWQDAVLWAYVNQGFRDREDGQVELKCTPEMEASFYGAPMDVDVWDCAAKMSFPVAVIRGTASDRFSFETETFRRFLSTLPGRCLTEEVPGLGHFLLMEKPDAVAALVGKYLKASG